MIAVPGFVAFSVVTLLMAAAFLVAHPHHKACAPYVSSSVTARVVDGRIVEAAPATTHGCTR